LRHHPRNLDMVVVRFSLSYRVSQYNLVLHHSQPLVLTLKSVLQSTILETFKLAGTVLSSVLRIIDY